MGIYVTKSRAAAYPHRSGNFSVPLIIADYRKFSLNFARFLTIPMIFIFIVFYIFLYKLQ